MTTAHRISVLLRRALTLPSVLYDLVYRPLDTGRSQRLPPSISAGNTGPVVTPEWSDNLKELGNILHQSGGTKFLRSDLVLRTMFVTNRLFILKELFFVLRYIKKRPELSAVLDESRTGYPYRYFLYPKSSGNLIHHTYSLVRFLGDTESSIDDFDRVIEFGGGYGSMARLFRRAGFRGCYEIYDLEPFSKLQAEYLNGLALEHRDELYVSNTHFRSEVTTLADIPLSSRTLFVGLWSISEVPLALRSVFEPFLRRCSVMLAMQDSFSGIDNISWIRDLQVDVPVEVKKIKHLSGNHYYFFKGPRANMTVNVE